MDPGKNVIIYFSFEEFTVIYLRQPRLYKQICYNGLYLYLLFWRIHGFIFLKN